MNKVKKFSLALLSLIAVTMLCTGLMLGMPFAAYAEAGTEPSGSEGDTTYVATVTAADGVKTPFDSIAGAVEAAQSGEKITLLTDVILEEPLTLDKSLTLDLGGKTITVNGKNYIKIKNAEAEITVTGGTIVQQKSNESVLSVNVIESKNVDVNDVQFECKNYGIQIGSNNAGVTTISGCTLTGASYGIIDYGKGVATISGCKLTDCNYGITLDKTEEITVADTQITGAACGIADWGKGALVVNNCKITSEIDDSVGIAGNGTAHGTNMAVTDTDITASCGIYHPQDGTLVVNGGTINATLSGVEMRAGSLTVKGNTVITVPQDIVCTATPNGSGTTVVGAAIAVSQHYTADLHNINVIIESATLTADKAFYQVDTDKTKPEVDITIAVNGGTFNGGISTERVDNFINGGTFSELPDSKYLTEETAFVQDENGNYSALSNEEAEQKTVAMIGDTARFMTLHGAVEAAQSGEKITLLTDVTLNKDLVLNKSLTLDLNGKTITHGGDKLKINNTEAEVVITDGSAENTGKIVQTATSGSNTSIWIIAAKTVTLQNFAVDSGDWGIYVGASCPVIMKNCTVEKSSIGFLVFGKGLVEVENCQITGKYEGIMGQGNNHGTNISLTDCTVISTDGTAIYHPQDGVLNVSGGRIEGGTGIEMRSGKLTIDGGAEIIATNEEYLTAANGSGTTVLGAAVAISQHTTNKEIAVTVNDATLTGIKALVQVDLQDIDEPNKVEIAVNGGTFNGGISTERVDNFINGGTFSELSDSKYLAEGVKLLSDGHGGYVALSYEKAVAEVLAYAEKYGVMLQDSHTQAILNAITVDEFDTAVAEAKAYVDELANAKQEAVYYVMLYAAAKNVNYTEEIAAILNDYVVVSVEGLAAVRSEAVAKLDEAYAVKTQLAQAKKDAIAEIRQAAAATEATATAEAQAAVVVPTATLAAINAAVDTLQVKEFKDNALAEIADIREYRKQISALGAKGGDILGAVTAFREALLGDGAENNGELAEALAKTETALKTYLAGVKDEINNYTYDELGKAKDALEAKITDAADALDGVIRDSADALTGKISAVQNTVGYVVEAFGIKLDEDSEKYISGTLNEVKAMLAELAEDTESDCNVILERLGVANTAIKNANDTLVKAVSDAETRLNEKLAALTAKADSLTGKLSEVNGGLLAELGVLGGKITNLGTVSSDALAAELAEIQTAITAIADKLQTAADVETEKSKATASINRIIDELLGGEKADTGAVALAAEAAAGSGMPAAQRDKLYATYGKDKAELIEGYYGEAMTAVENATTAAEARAAADNFGRRVDTVKIIDGLDTERGVSLGGVYACIVISILLSATALLLTVTVLLRKRK